VGGLVILVSLLAILGFMVIPINSRFVRTRKKHDFTSIPLPGNYLNLREVLGFGPAAELVA
jgi:hypothetical protein